MQASSSLLDRIFSPSTPLLLQHDHRRSRSQSPSIPARSPQASHSGAAARITSWSTPETSHSDPFLTIDRATKSLQLTIQSLLDAQSEALLASLASSSWQQHVPSDELCAPPPTAPSSAFSPEPSIIPVRQPQNRKVSLRGARRGLSRAIHDFVALKHHEETIIDDEIQRRMEVLNRIEAYTSKRKHLQYEIDSISADTGAQSASHLRTEASELEIYIQDMEDKLYEMKARHGQLIDHAQRLENSVQAQLSSYNVSLDLLDNEIRQFLMRPPITAYSNSRSGPTSNDASAATATFHDLAPKWRTLQMASEYWRSECEALQTRKASIAVDRAALEAGGSMWGQVVADIQSHERHLKVEMEKLSLSSISPDDKDDGMVKVLQMLNGMIDRLEQRTCEAEARDWNLLICGIGAELAAFREGRQILAEAASHLKGRQQAQQIEKGSLINDQPATNPPNDTTFPRQLGLDVDTDARLEIHATNGIDLLPPKVPQRIERIPALCQTQSSSVATTANNDPFDTRSNTNAAAAVPAPRYESEDDDPGPAFLISHS